MLEVRDFELVHAIAAHGNFARASRALAIGQPVLSRRVADLEHRLGGPLFLRTRFGAEPTDLCRALLVDAELILERIHGLERRLTASRGKQSEDLRVAAGGIAAGTSVVAAAAAMMGEEPEVRVNLASMNWMDVLYAVREREVEFGVLELTNPEEIADLVVEPLLRHPGFFAARAGHPLAAHSGLTLAEILSYPLIFLGKLPTRVIGPFAAAREAAQASGSLHPSFPALVHESPGAALPVVLESDAVIVVTAPIVHLALRSGDIAVLPWQEPWATTNFGIVQVRGRRVSAAATKFVELLRKADAKAFDAGQVLLAQVNARKDGLGLPLDSWAPEPSQDALFSPGSTNTALPSARPATPPSP